MAERSAKKKHGRQSVNIGLYFSEALPDDFQPSSEDTAFASAFRKVADVIEGSKKPEQLAFRLSTCRNIYLTTNALFFDLSRILGHGKMPSHLSSLLVDLDRNDIRSARKRLLEIGRLLGTFDDKMNAWTDRTDLDRIFYDAQKILNKEDRDNVNMIIHNVRTSSKSLGQPPDWNKKYYEFSDTVEAHVEEVIDKFLEIRDAIKAIKSVAEFLIGIIQDISETPLITGDKNVDWTDALKCMRDSADTLHIGVDEDSCTSSPAISR